MQSLTSLFVILEQYYFHVNEVKPNPKLIIKREKGILYSVNSWNGKFYNHTNKDAEDFKIDISETLENQNWETFIPAKKEVLIGGLSFLNKWIIRSETSDLVYFDRQSQSFWADVGF